MELKIGQRVLARSSSFSDDNRNEPKYFEMEYKGRDMNDDSDHYYKQRHHFVGVGHAYNEAQLWTPDINTTFNEGYLKLKDNFTPSKIPMIRHRF